MNIPIISKEFEGIGNFNQIVIDQTNSLICASSSIHQDSGFIEQIRSSIKSKFFAKGYHGFSDEYDRYFDPFSIYFYVSNKSKEIHAVQRVIHKTPQNLLPLEKALIKGSEKNKRYTIDEQDTVEISSFLFKSARSIDLLVFSIAHYGKLNRIKKAYALLDIDSKSLEKIYGRFGWEESMKYNTPVYFPDYGKISNGRFEPTLWKVLELPEEKISKIAENISKYQIVSLKN
ncbi:MAG: LBL_2463 family protein [Candidatus Margulisiibacteriota bacterium]